MSIYFPFFGLTKVPTYRPYKSRITQGFLPFRLKKWRDKSLTDSAPVPERFHGPLNLDLLYKVQSFARNEWEYETERGDNWKTGPEMLRDKKGDCEDFAAGKVYLLSKAASPLHAGILVTPGHASAYVMFGPEEGYILDNGGLGKGTNPLKMKPFLFYAISPFAAWTLYDSWEFERVKVYPKDFSISALF